MPQPPEHIVRLEEDIAEVLDLRDTVKADRSFFRDQVEACTERLKHLRDVYTDLERRLQDALYPHPMNCAVRRALSGPLWPYPEGPATPFDRD